MYTIALYTIILRILHSLYEFAYFIHNIYTYVVNFLSFNNDDDDVERVTLEIRNLKKKPHHLVFMLGNEEPSFKDLANIVLWSTAAGIPIITFYDHIGLLKQTISQFYKVLADKNIKFTSSNIKQQNGHKNGFSEPHPIEINVFTLQDGQKSVALVAQECVRNHIRNDEVTIEYVDKQLKKQIGDLPDPELALYCGRICSTYGLLPWQIRLTEFIDVTSHRGICLSQFIFALKRYERSEQRYGK